MVAASIRTPISFSLRSDADKEPVLSPEHTDAVWLPLERLQASVDRDVPAKHTLYEDITVLVDFLA